MKRIQLACASNRTIADDRPAVDRWRRSRTVRQAGRAFRSPYTACRCIGACSRFGKRPKADFRRVATGIAVTEKMFQVLHTLPLKCFQLSSWASARFLAKPRLSMAVLRFKVAFYLNHAVFFNAVEGPPFCVLARRALLARRAVAVLQHRVAVATINLRGLQEGSNRRFVP